LNIEENLYMSWYATFSHIKHWSENLQRLNFSYIPGYDYQKGGSQSLSQVF